MVCREMAFLPPPSSAADHQFFFQNHLNVDNQADHDPSSLNVLSSCPPQDLIHGHPHHLSSLSMMNHHHHQHAMSLSPAVSYNNFTNDDHHQQQQQTAPNNNNNGVGDDELSEEEGSHLMMSLGEKKKRLSLEQVKTLEKSFELGNKLEPERKMQLAKALGLQPRQVAIWFQNRRARWKTKQLEKDYNLLKRQCDSLKADNDSLQTQNKKLHAELLSLKNGKDPTEFRAINLNAETKSYCWSNNGSEISSDINLGMSTATPRGSTPPPPPPQQEDLHIVHHHHHHHDHSSPSNNNINKHQLDQFTSSFLPTSLTDLLTKSSSHDQAAGGLQDDGFCSLFGGGGGGGGGSSGGGGSAGVGVQEQPPPFWAWPPDQHHLH